MGPSSQADGPAIDDQPTRPPDQVVERALAGIGPVHPRRGSTSSKSQAGSRMSVARPDGESAAALPQERRPFDGALLVTFLRVDPILVVEFIVSAV